MLLGIPMTSPLRHTPIIVGLVLVLAFFGAGLIQKDRQAPTEAPLSQGASAPQRIVRPKEPPLKQDPSREDWRQENDLAAQWKQAEWAWLAMIAAYLSAAFTGLGILFVKQTLDATRRSLEQTQRQAEAATQANELLRVAHITEQRPWVKVEARIGGDLFYNVNGLNVTIRYQLKNIGHSPALNTWIDTEIFAPAITVDPPYNPVALQANAVHSAKQKPQVPFGYLVFPGDTIIQDISMSLGKDELARITQKVNFVSISIISVVGYSTVFDSRRRHTALLLELRRTGNPKAAERNRAPDAVIVDDGDIPANQLKLMRSPVVPEYAD